MLFLKKMSRFKNQKGFATIEIFLVVMIIAILSGIAIPKIAQVLDVAQLDYETRRFVSEFYFAKSLSKSSNFEPEFFSGVTLGGNSLYISVSSRSYYTEDGTKIIHERHFLPKKFSIKRGINVPVNVKFMDGKISPSISSEYIFNAPRGFSEKIKIDSVGRVHVERTKNN